MKPKRWTVDEIIAHAAEHGGPWHLDHFQCWCRIRNERGACPLGTLPGARDLLPVDPFSGIDGITTRVSERITHAADNSGAPRTREKMLRAFGLEEKS